MNIDIVKLLDDEKTSASFNQINKKRFIRHDTLASIVSVQNWALVIICQKLQEHKLIKVTPSPNVDETIYSITANGLKIQRDYDDFKNCYEKYTR